MPIDNEMPNNFSAISPEMMERIKDALRLEEDLPTNTPSKKDYLETKVFKIEGVREDGSKTAIGVNNLTLPKKQEFDLSPYQSPKAVEMFIDSMEEKSGKKLSEEERSLLSTNPALAERVFNGGLKDAIVNDKATITELSKLSPEAVASLTYAHSQAALNDGSIKVEQIAALNPEELKKFDRSAVMGNHKEVSKILDLDKKQADTLGKSFDEVDERIKDASKAYDGTNISAPAMTKEGLEVLAEKAAAKAYTPD